MSHQDPFGNDGTEPTRPSKPDDDDDHMQKKGKNVPHARDGIKLENRNNSVTCGIRHLQGRLTSQTLPESGTTSFTYNSDSLPVTKTDARNVVTTTTYHSTQVHQIGSQTYSDGTATISFNYNTQGLRSSMTDAVGTVTYIYDSNTDKLTLESRTLTGVTGTFTTGYGYNIKGDMTSMTHPSGRMVNFNYATGGGCCNSRLSSVVDQTTGTTIASSISYDAAGDITSRTLGNGVVEVFSFNNRLQETGITDTLSGTALMNFSYNYGTSSTNTGRVLSRTDSIQPEHSVNYSYDSLYRLSQANAPDSSWGVSWTFDAWGNRLTQTPSGVATSKIGSQTFGYSNNRNTSFSYDAAGNQTNDGSHNYVFNAENQIASMDGGATTYTYDGDGRRMKKVTATETTYAFYGAGGIISEFTTSNTIATATAASSTDQCLYHTTDKLGSAVLVMTANGKVLENNRTLPYGEAWLTETASTNDKKFTSYQRDAESGLDYALNRYDAGNRGVFMSTDPGSIKVAQPQSLNRYTYGMNDPLNYSDKTGKDWVFAGFILQPTPPVELCIDVGTAWGDSGSYAITECITVGVFAYVATYIWQGPPDCTKDFEKSHVDFVQTNYADSVRLGRNAAIPDTWVLGWSAEESGWGSGRVAQANGNPFSWTGTGNIVCPPNPNVNPNFGCLVLVQIGLQGLFVVSESYHQPSVYAGLASGEPRENESENLFAPEPLSTARYR